MANSVSDKKVQRTFSWMTVVLMLAASMLVAIPFGTQNAEAVFFTPGTGINWNFDDLALMSGGAVTGGGGFYQVHDTIVIQPPDEIHLLGGELVEIDPFMGILIVVDGTFDGTMGSGAEFNAGGTPGAWQGFLVSGPGNFMIDDVNIYDAVDGVFADNTIMTEIRNCEISNCQNTGITYNMVMGGPMVETNNIHNCDIGILTTDSSTMMFGNWISDNRVGVQAGGMAGPAIDGNEIFSNTDYGIYLDVFDGGVIANNWIFDNEIASIYSDSSFADIWSNTITGWDALPGTSMPGGNAIYITGTAPSMWYTTIAQNTIRGGHGDESVMGWIPDGGHGIAIENFEGNVVPGPQLLIDQNTLISGGNGGPNNFEDMWTAGNGGHGIYIPSIPDDGDWLTDNHAIKITNNQEIRGGVGGEFNGNWDSSTGNGGHGIYVSDDDSIGSLKVSTNVLISGGKGGDNWGMDSGIGLYGAGDGGDAIHVNNCQPGARVEILGNPDIRGAPAGIGFMTPVDNEGGFGLRFEG